jgi:hypothetical protein
MNNSNKKPQSRELQGFRVPRQVYLRMSRTVSRGERVSYAVVPAP